MFNLKKAGLPAFLFALYLTWRRINFF